MARAYSISDMSDPDLEPQPGEWQALRGELVALLDQVEGRYARVEPQEPALSGLAKRVRNLRDQVVGPEPAIRRREALRTVKRAVDRFSDRDEDVAAPVQDALSSAISEIRGRQMSASAAALGRRPADMPEFRELTILMKGLSGRLERLEGDLKAQRASNGNVNEVASQVEQLTHVVELLAGAVGETGQVKRLESQIGALAALIEQGPKVDLSAINKRLDDVSGTVAKLAELQAQQMEREIGRDERLAAAPPAESAGTLAPAMQAIEKSVRNVYDRIDSIEKNVALSSGDFERLTSEMAAFTAAMKQREAAPGKLVAKVDAIADRLGSLDTSNGDVAGLKQDISDLRDAVMSSMEPRFTKIESRIEALSERIVAPADTAQVESQLKLLMQRMDETGSQLNGLAKLYTGPSEPADMEAMATLVAERTSDALTRKAPAPVAMFGPDSLKSIEDRLTGLLKGANKQPDYEALAAMVAEKTSEAVARSAQPAAPAGVSEESMSALEQRVTAILNTAGKDTAERLARLEATLNFRQEAAPAPMPAPARAQENTLAKAMEAKQQAIVPSAPAKPEAGKDRLDAMLAALASPTIASRSDAMPVNPGDDAPLIDPGYANPEPTTSAFQARVVKSGRSDAEPESLPSQSAKPQFDPTTVERPARPQSSFAKSNSDPFAPITSSAAPEVEAPVSQSSTSTFVAAARRAQRARQDAPVAEQTSNSLISRALARVMPGQSSDATTPQVKVEEPLKAERPVKPVKEKPVKARKEKPALAAGNLNPETDTGEVQPSFLKRHRRPLLLAATLVVVSLLALNLVMQRMSAPSPKPAAPAATAPTPAASDDVSFVRPEPRMIDMVDGTATGSINAASSAGFTKPDGVTPMPSSLMTPDLVLSSTSPISPDTTGSIPSADSVMESFELPIEGVGPIELRQAAADGDARAQFEVGAIFTEGRAVPQDYAEAAKWYERAAAKGFVPAQYRLGNLYETGTGVEKDIELARLWYQRSAEAGNRMAMHNLAALYAGGMLGDQQFETAAEWFTKAAERGMTDSQFNLGMLFARGLGVEQDFSQSYKWFSLAARGGDTDAAKARDDIAKSLTADIVSQVNEDVGAWKAVSIELDANFAPIGTWSASFDPGDAIAVKDVVVKVQQALNRLGFDVGTPDGISGSKTAEAIKAFERGTGMSEVGIINPRLLAVLGSQPV